MRDDALWSFDGAQEIAARVLSPLVPSSGSAPLDAVYEPTAANRLPTWESLVTWVR